MKIAILCYQLHGGAFAAIARTLSKGLVELGAEVEVWYLQPGTTAQPDAAHPPAANLVQLGGRARSSTPRIARALRSHSPDVLISLGWLLNLPAIAGVALARSRTKLILNEQSSLSYKVRNEHRHEMRFRFLDHLAKRLYPRAAAITGTSSAVVHDLIEHIGISPTSTVFRVIPNSVDGEEVRARAAASRPERRPGTVFVNVARHAQQKNLELLLRSFAAFLDGGEQGSLVLIGDGPQTEILIQLTEELGITEYVSFEGHLLNPFPLLASATAFVLSSEEEGFGLVLVEAMALDVPVISTDCLGAPRELLLDGRAGVLVPPDDVDALAAAMARITHDVSLREAVMSAGRMRADDFEPAQIAKQWLDLAQLVLDQAVPGATEWMPANGGSSYEADPLG